MAARKGFKNKLSNWWKGKRGSGPCELNELGFGVRFEHDSSESQLRRMGDLAFMMGDFETASSAYRSVSTDYKETKVSWCMLGVETGQSISDVFFLR